MTSKRIFVIYTGGTLGMQPTPRGYQPVAGWLEQQLRQLPELQAGDMPEFVLHEYAPLLDSSDMQPADWQTIAADIHAHYDDYDGFVVLHGTDTLAYTAAALQCLLPGCSKPIIVTGAQIPLAEAGSDAGRNIRNAFCAAAAAPLAPVAVLFDRQLLRADYASKTDADALAAFSSPNAAPLLQWHGDELQLPVAPAGRVTRPQLQQVMERQIAVVPLYPGLNLEWLAQWLHQPWDAVILQTFGSGNAPQQPLLLQALRQAAERGVWLINRSQCAAGTVRMDGYAGGHALAACGVMAAGRQSLEYLIARLQTASAAQWHQPHTLD